MTKGATKKSRKPISEKVEVPGIRPSTFKLVDRGPDSYFLYRSSRKLGTARVEEDGSWSARFDDAQGEQQAEADGHVVHQRFAVPWTFLGSLQQVTCGPPIGIGGSANLLHGHTGVAVANFADAPLPCVRFGCGNRLRFQAWRNSSSPSSTALSKESCNYAGVRWHVVGKVARDLAPAIDDEWPLPLTHVA